jgi:hypothetical protein
MTILWVLLFDDGEKYARITNFSTGLLYWDDEAIRDWYKSDR